MTCFGACSHRFGNLRIMTNSMRREILAHGWGDRMTSGTAGKSRRFLIAIARWFDTSAGGPPDPDAPQKTDWFRCIPFVVVHLMCLGVIWVGWSPIAVAVAVALYFIRMFAITGFYHRYFSHRSFKTSRAGQFIFAADRRDCGATRSVVVGVASSAASSAIRRADRCTFAGSAGIHLEPHRMDHVGG